MKNQFINLKQLLTGIGFFSLFTICSGFEAKADAINDSGNNIFGNKKIKWVKYDGYKQIKDDEIEKVWKKNVLRSLFIFNVISLISSKSSLLIIFNSFILSFVRRGSLSESFLR